MSFLVNKTILILGDSVDRNGLHQMAEMLGLPRYPVPYRDWSERGNIPWGWDARGIPWVVEIPWFNTIFTNGFFYGLVRTLVISRRCWTDVLHRTTRTICDSSLTGTRQVSPRIASTSSSRSTLTSCLALRRSSRCTLVVRAYFALHAPFYS